MQSVDSILLPRWVIPVTEPGQVLEDHGIAIHQGRIVAVAPQAYLQEKYQAAETVTLANHALIPGLVNAHTHAAMNLLKGIADDLPLMQWLEEHIWPAEGQHVSREFVSTGTQLACAEMLRSGTTTFNDMYFYPDAVATAAESVGMRASVGLIVLDFPTVWAQNAGEYLAKGIEIHDHYRNSALISTTLAPHAPYTVSDEPLQKIASYAHELDVPVHIHVHETAFEVAQAEEQNGMRPLQRLDKLGLLGPQMIAVHMTQLTEAEIALCAERNLHIAHCPESNLKLASGFCPTTKLLQAGVNVAIGTDGSASNNDLNMLGEMQTTALLAKGVVGDAQAIPAWQALEMATLGGARALGLQQDIGSIEPGKAADLTAIDLNAVETQPLYDPISQIVYAAGREQVSDVWVAGRRLLKQGELTTLNTSDLLAEAESWRARIQQSASDNT